MAAYETRQGSWCDVITVPTGWALAYVDGDDVVCEVNAVEIWRQTVGGGVVDPTYTGAPRFIRAACDASGLIKAIVSISDTSNLDHAILVAEAGLTDLMVCKQAHPVALTFEAADFIAYICDSFDTYIRWPQAGVPSAPIAIGRDSVLGFLDVVDGTPLWANSETGGYTTEIHANTVFMLPNTREGVVVGQAKGEPVTREGIITWNRTVVSTVIDVQGFDPRICKAVAGTDAGKYIVCARILGEAGNNLAFAIIATFPGYDGSLIAALSPPVQHPVEEPTSFGTRMTQPWQGWAQSVKKALTNAATLIGGVTDGLVDLIAFAQVSVTGQPLVIAESAADRLTLASADGSVTITTNPDAKTVDFSATAAGALDAQFIVAAAHALLSAERVATNNEYTEWDFATAAQAKVNLLGPLPLLLADPATPSDNRVWFFATAATVPATISLRVRLNGVTYEIPLGTII